MPIPRFGRVENGVKYITRPGAYAVIPRIGKRERLVAVLKVADKFYLPGGGKESDESNEDALKREVREETGLSVRIIRPTGVAIEYVFASTEGTYFEKIESFYDARVIGRPGTGTKADHELVWLTISDAAAGMA